MRNVPRRTPGSLRLAAALLFSAVQAWPQAQAQIVTDNISYNVGSVVRVDVIFPSAQAVRPTSELWVTLRYSGETEPLLNQVPLSSSSVSSGRAHSTGYREIWKIPSDARTGRYEVALGYRDTPSHETFHPLARPASFVVHRKLIRIHEIKLDKTFYTSGDAVACAVGLENLSDKATDGLRVEFSDRYWPWIGSYSGKTRIVALNEARSMAPHQKLILQHAAAAIAETVQQPAVHQYAVVVWDHERKNIYDIAFSPLVVVQPAGVARPKPYPGQYAHPTLDAVKVTSYRHFYPPELDSAAIEFDHSHTMWPTNSDATVTFSVVNPTAKPWRGISVRARLVGPDGAEAAGKSLAAPLDLEPGGPRLTQEATFTLPGQPGLYRAVVEAHDPTGMVLAANALELGVNPLPKSILVFCAHEDDEGGHAGLYRAAVENHIPIHFLYYTSGDAGSCDRYYQHSCDPSEALNFGTIRMQEVRGALGHLGVGSEDIFFLGLPDGGSGEIWSKHVQPSNPYFGVLLATDHAPYEGLLRPNLPYARESVLEATQEFIKKYQPEVIYTAHPGDVRHIDHIVNNYFVVKALQQLAREGAISPNLALLVDEVHDPKAQPATPYHYRSYGLNVSGEVKALAQEAGWYHQSQGGTRAAESIRTLNQLPRTEAFRRVVDWMEHEGWNEKQ